MKKSFSWLVLIVVVLGFSVCGWAQLGMFSKEQRLELTREWKGDRFPDGRPKVPDELLNRLKTVDAQRRRHEAASETRHGLFRANYRVGQRTFRRPALELIQAPREPAATTGVAQDVRKGKPPNGLLSNRAIHRVAGFAEKRSVEGGHCSGKPGLLGGFSIAKSPYTQTPAASYRALSGCLLRPVLSQGWRSPSSSHKEMSSAPKFRKA